MLYQKLISDFTDMSKELIGENLIGVYLHGSMAMNCFNPHKSDVDILIVIEHNITDMTKMAFMKRVVELNAQAPAKGLEISIVKRKYCKPFRYPTPFELHFSPMHLPWFKKEPEEYVKKMKGKDKDLAAHVIIIKKYGIVLFGEKIETVFGEIAKKDYFESIWSDVENAKEDIVDNTMYITLTLCRVLAFLQENLYLSKRQGGEWGIKHVSDKYHPLILQALNSYKSNQMMQVDSELANEFVDEMLVVIRFEGKRIE